MPAQRAQVPYEPCQYPDPVAGDECARHAVAILTAVYSYDNGRRVIRIDEVLCRSHGVARVRDLMTARCDTVVTWHARSVGPDTIRPTRTRTELHAVGAS